MNDRARDKDKSRRYFWRACRYLWPYRAKVTISIVAAFFVGLAMTGGLTTMIPIMQVMISGDTLQEWVYRQTAEKRLGVKLVSEPTIVSIAQVSGEPAQTAGLKRADTITGASVSESAPPSPFPTIAQSASRNTYEQAYPAAEILRNIAWTRTADGRGGGQVELTTNGQKVTLQLQPLPSYSFILMKIVERLPLTPVRSVAIVFAFAACISLFGNTMRFFQEHLSDQAAILAANDIRQRLYDRVLRIPMSSIGQQGASDVTSRLVTDVDNLQDGFKTILGQSIQEPIKAAMAFGFALYVNWKLTMFVIILAPLMGAMMKRFGKKMRRASRAALRSSSVLLGQIEGTLVGIRIVKGYNAEKYERRRYSKILYSLIGEQIRMSRIDAFSSPVMETIILVMAGLVVLVGTYMLTESHTITAPSFFAVMTSLAVIAESLRRASKVNNALQKASAAATRLFEMLDLKPEREHGQLPPAVSGNGATTPRKLPVLQNAIEFQEIVFTYPNATSPALNGISLTVPKGQSVAVVGRNGSGKTTLLALLERFYDPDSGRILIDGVDIRSVTRTSLREQISLVTQDSHIFPGTIAENIAYGEVLANPNAPDSPERRQIFARIEDAARRAFAHDFINEKGGYDFKLEGIGGQLSGGQRQRLCIARAVYHQSPILILDEATSQVDAESEHYIHEAIEHLIHERTTFVIAHRFSTILSADTIVVLERGVIVGQGRHDELLRSCPIYRQLYERQIMGGEGEAA
jgi:ABC-type multidrug transport system fused ATPase/permease subunit